MRQFLKKYIRPVFRALGIQKAVYHYFFYLNGVTTDVCNRLDKKLRKTVPILTYHRIANVSKDPHLLCVPPPIFEKHLQFLSQNYEVISLSGLHERLSKKTLRGNEAVITFDDGYRDNLTNALPLLEKYVLPATIFLNTAHLGERADAPWDQEYTEDERAVFLNPEEVTKLAEHPLITIGAHTHAHVRLSTLSREEQKNEINTNKEILENITHQPILHFAYPFGGMFDYTKETENLLIEAGFNTLSTTKKKFITSSTSSRNLTRFNIRAYSQKELADVLLSN